jgi:hypothetical protein
VRIILDKTDPDSCYFPGVSINNIESSGPPPGEIKWANDVIYGVFRQPLILDVGENRQSCPTGQ